MNKEKEVLDLTLKHGMPVDDISAMTGLSRASVRRIYTKNGLRLKAKNGMERTHVMLCPGVPMLPRDEAERRGIHVSMEVRRQTESRVINEMNSRRHYLAAYYDNFGVWPKTTPLKVEAKHVQQLRDHRGRYLRSIAELKRYVLDPAFRHRPRRFRIHEAKEPGAPVETVQPTFKIDENVPIPKKHTASKPKPPGKQEEKTPETEVSCDPPLVENNDGIYFLRNKKGRRFVAVPFDMVQEALDSYKSAKSAHEAAEEANEVVKKTGRADLQKSSELIVAKTGEEKDTQKVGLIQRIGRYLFTGE